MRTGTARRKRRCGAVRRFRNRHRKQIVWAMRLLIAVAALLAVTLTVRGAMKRQPEAPEIMPEQTTEAERPAEEPGKIVFYEIPEEYAENGGELPTDVQEYISDICREYGIEADIVFAIIEESSGYRPDAESGAAYGYMQVIPQMHTERIDRLGIRGILNPYGNIAVGVDYLAELLRKYDGCYRMALTAYRWGVSGAEQDYFSKGQSTSGYAESVLNRADRIREEVQK